MTKSADPTPLLSLEHLATVRTVLNALLPGADVRIFGSRASGAARPFSDIDLLVVKPSELTWLQRADLKDAFEASDLPFCVDILEFSRAPAPWRDAALSDSIQI